MEHEQQGKKKKEHPFKLMQNKELIMYHFPKALIYFNRKHKVVQRVEL